MGSLRYFPFSSNGKAVGHLAAFQGMKLVYVFPGQGSQYQGMASGKLAEDPDAKRVFAAASEISGVDVLSLCSDGNPSLLARTDLCQIGVASTSLAWLTLLEKEGYRPLGVAGHSLGECCAACAAGCMGVEETLRLVWARGRSMLECSLSQPGSMLAVLGLQYEEVRELVEEVRSGGFLYLANHNGSAQYVVSGDQPSLERMECLARKRGARTARLKVSGAFHTPAFAPAVEAVREILRRIALRDPSLPFFSGLTGAPLADAASVARALAEGISSPVLWSEAQRGLVELGAGMQVEVGPGKSLNTIARRDHPRLAVRHASELLEG